jgi:inorganic triphosphatase YgiF
MVPQKELELKFEVEPSALRLLNKIQPIKALNKRPVQTAEASVYFDTDKHKLHKKGLLLRVRRIGKRHVQTIKATGNSAPIERNEWETEISGAEPDFRMIDGTPLEGTITKKIRRRLKPMFETRIRRTTYPFVNKERAVELTIDRGKIDSGDVSVPVCELELELKRGSKSQLFEVARTLTHTLPAQVSLKSKAERGYELVEGSKNLPAKAVSLHFGDGCSARDGFPVIGFACLKQIVDNVPALAKADPEGVHQMRVGVRRLRAAVSLFGELLHDGQTTTLKTELKWLAGELTPAREFEVLTDRVIAPLKQQRGSLPHRVRSFSTALAKKRKTALARAKDAVASARFRKLTFEVATWLEIGRWTKPEDDLVRSRGEVLVEAFAEEQLQGRLRKVRRRGKDLVRLNAKQRHKLRIQVKKLRYAAEFFGDLFQGKKAVRRQKKFTSALKQLQDGLGDLNDIAVDERLIASVATHNNAFATGLLTGREEARESEAMSVALQGYAKLVKAKPFWR